MIALILGGLIAITAVMIVALPFLRDSGEPDVIDNAETRGRLELMEVRDRALGALKELEFDHKTGKVDDVDYRQLVGPLRRAAAEALQALEGRAPGERAAPERAVGSAEERLPEKEHVQSDD